jgi:cell division cycle protein 20 (cofactor of APC complex)
VPSRKSFSLPLNASPRTTRIAHVFGLTDDRILSFTDPGPSTPDSKTFQSLRRNVLQLFHQPKAVSPFSASANLGKNRQFVLALDAPGVPSDPLAYPLTWSITNKIAVACGHDVYYQDLDTRVVEHLCNLTSRIRVIDWATEDPDAIALGAEGGVLNLWDAREAALVRDWKDEKRQAVHSLSWHQEVLAVGERPGSVMLYDVRMPAAIAKLGGHKVPVYALKWSPDGRHLASGDASGFVQIWDATACKTLGQGTKLGGKMRHKALVKVFYSIYLW